MANMESSDSSFSFIDKVPLHILHIVFKMKLRHRLSEPEFGPGLLICKTESRRTNRYICFIYHTCISQAAMKLSYFPDIQANGSWFSRWKPGNRQAVQPPSCGNTRISCRTSPIVMLRWTTYTQQYRGSILPIRTGHATESLQMPVPQQRVLIKL